MPEDHPPKPVNDHERAQIQWQTRMEVTLKRVASDVGELKTDAKAREEAMWKQITRNTVQLATIKGQVLALGTLASAVVAGAITLIVQLIKGSGS